MKKLLLISLMVLITTSMLLVGCGGDEETTTAPTSTSAPTTTAPAPTTSAPAPTATPTKPIEAPTATAHVPTGTITIASVDFSYESTDPIFYESFWGWSMYDNLITYDVNGNYMGSVAESWSISEDGNTWTFNIRKGMKFHNGDPVTAYDVKFSVDRFASTESTNPWSPYLRNNLRSTAVTDDYTFVYRTNHPEPPLVVPFAWTRILPKNYFEEVGQDEFRRNPVGSGPWKFVEHVAETSFKMEAYTEHWRQVPYFQYIEDLQVPEEATRIAMLKRGEVDIALGITTDRLIELRDSGEGFHTEVVGLPTLHNLSFPGTFANPNKPTSDIRVREAMSLAINRQELCDTFYQGLAVPGGRWFMHEGGSYGWDPSWTPDPYDPDRAKQLLAEAGYPDAFSDPTITYFVSPGPGVDLAQVEQSYWAEVGIVVDIEIVDAGVWGGMFFVRNTAPDAPNIGGIFPWTFGSTFNSVYHSANLYTSGGVHSTGNDPIADEMYAAATGELDGDKALQFWTDLRTYTYDHMKVNIGVVTIQPLMLIGPKLGEFGWGKHMSLYDGYATIQHP